MQDSSEVQNPTLDLDRKNAHPLANGRFQLEPLDSVFPQIPVYFCYFNFCVFVNYLIISRTMCSLF